MNITTECKISAIQSQGLANNIKMIILEVIGKCGDFIKINQVNGVRLKEIVAAYEYPDHKYNTAWDNEDTSISLGGSKEKSERTIFVIGK